MYEKYEKIITIIYSYFRMSSFEKFYIVLHKINFY
jgi:hypothetical protein